MNRKGSVFFGLTLGIFLFIMGVLIMPYILDDITTARTDLDCAGAAISSGTKLTCLFVGAINPYYIWFFSSIALGLVVGGFKG